MTPSEDKAFKVLNTVLDQAYAYIPGLEDSKEANGPEMLDRYVKARDALYSATDVINNVLQGRRSLVRAECIQVERAAATTSKVATANVSIKPETWLKTSTDLITKNREEWEKLSLESIKASFASIKSLMDLDATAAISAVKALIATKHQHCQRGGAESFFSKLRYSEFGEVPFRESKIFL
jgi:hypothetical protein